MGLSLFLLCVLLPTSAFAVSYELDPIHPSFCSKGSAANQCETGMRGVAVDQSNGNVYQVDQNNGRIDAFDASGAFLWAAGWKVNAAAPAEIFQICTLGTGCAKGTKSGLATNLGKITEGARGIAVDPATHIVYVATTTIVKYFNGQSGALLGEFSATAGNDATGSAMPPSPVAPNAFAAASGIAVDSSAAQHYLYVAATVSVVDKFKVPVVTAGSLATQASYVCQITGLAVASATECHVTASKDGGEEGLSFTGKKGGDLAVDSTSGNLIVAEGETASVNRKTVSVFDSTGAFVKQFKTKIGAAEVPAEAVAAGAGGHVFVAVESPAGKANEGGLRVQEYDLALPAAPVSEFGAGTVGTAAAAGSLGVAVDLSGLASNGHIYVADSSVNAKIWNYIVGIPGSPEVKEPESEVSSGSATLKAKVNPKNAATTYHFEYINDTDYIANGSSFSGATPASATPETPIGSDNVFHAVAEEITGLTVETLYHWRIVATNSSPGNPVVVGTSQAFTTLPVPGPPTVEEQAISGITQIAARLEAKVNPHGKVVDAAGEHVIGFKDCEFRYTTDPSFFAGIQKSPCSSPSSLGNGGKGVGTSAVLSGLVANTKYYWRVYAANQESLSIATGSLENFITAPVSPTAATLSPATSIGDAVATLPGTVNPQGAPTLGGFSSCRFEWGPASGVYTLGTTACAPDPGGATSSAGVSGAATGLAADRTYHYRVVITTRGGAVNGVDLPGVTVGGGDQTFATSGRPEVAQTATAITETSAKLGAIINPAGLATTYHLEYVDDATFEADQPSGFAHATKTLESASIGADHTDHGVPAEQIAGLQPNTLYHYRFVAQNGSGITELARTFATSGPVESSCSNEARRSENGSAELPDCRAYELVSPADKNFGGVDGSASVGVTGAEDGDAAAFCTDAGLSEAPNGGACIDYLSRRGSTGWTTKTLVPAFCPRDLGEAINNPSVLAQVRGFSANLNFAAFNRPEVARPEPAYSCGPFPRLDSSAPELGSNLYVEDLDADPTAYKLLAPVSAPSPSYTKPTAEYAASSNGYSHVVYVSSGQQTLDATPVNGSERVFDWHDGTVSLVSKAPAPSNTVFATESFVPDDAVNGVSADGSRIFFQNPSSGSSCTSTCQLYLRVADSATYLVSESECTSSCGAGAPAKFEWATANGDKALFRSAQKLTNGDTSSVGEDLFMYTQSPNPTSEQNLTLLSQDNEPADGTEAGVFGVIGISADSDTVYFAAKGQIVSGGPTAAGPKVYRWRWNAGSPTVTYLATLQGGGVGPSGGPDHFAWEGEEGGGSVFSEPASRLVTADGTRLLLETVKPLDPIADGDSSVDVYRWDVQEGWSCLSCQEPSVPSAGSSVIDALRLLAPGATANSTVRNQNRRLRVKMSSDGSTVFFTSRDALVAADTDGSEDVYEWRDGTVNLVSSGGSGESTLIAASVAARDVFFYSADRLVGWDGDGASDIYDARVGGGFQEPPTPQICEGEACRGAGTSAPAADSAGTASLVGPGDPTRPRPCRKGTVKRKGKCVAKPSRHGQKRHHKHRHPTQKGR